MSEMRYIFVLNESELFSVHIYLYGCAMQDLLSVEELSCVQSWSKIDDHKYKLKLDNIVWKTFLSYDDS